MMNILARISLWLLRKTSGKDWVEQPSPESTLTDFKNFLIEISNNKKIIELVNNVNSALDKIPNKDLDKIPDDKSGSCNEIEHIAESIKDEGQPYNEYNEELYDYTVVRQTSVPFGKIATPNKYGSFEMRGEIDGESSRRQRIVIPVEFTNGDTIQIVKHHGKNDKCQYCGGRDNGCMVCNKGHIENPLRLSDDRINYVESAAEYKPVSVK
jgi:hypothetical protein